jgi:hypothetical protein
MLAVPIPEQCASADIGTASALAKEFGELFSALAPALVDGQFTEADLPNLKRIIAEGDDLIGAVLAVRRCALDALPQAQAIRFRPVRSA